MGYTPHGMKPWIAIVGALLALLSSVGPIGIVAAQSDPTVVIRTSGGYGPILADPDGFTLYMWAADEPGVSRCYDACADEWPPYLADSSPVAPIGFPGALGLVDRGDGTWQVALDGMPLYYFDGDNSPGDTNGHGNAGFGAPWHIVAFGPPAAAGAPGSAPMYGTPQLGTPGQMPPPSALQGPPPTSSSSRPGIQGQPLPPPGYAAPLGLPPAPGYPYVQTPPFGAGYAGGSFSQTVTIQSPPNGIVGLSWVANPAASSYRIYTTPVSQPLNFSVSQTVQQPTGQLITNALVTTLAPGGTYYVQVRTVSPTGLETVTPASAFSTPSLGR